MINAHNRSLVGFAPGVMYEVTFCHHVNESRTAAGRVSTTCTCMCMYMSMSMCVTCASITMQREHVSCIRRYCLLMYSGVVYFTLGRARLGPSAVAALDCL